MILYTRCHLASVEQTPQKKQQRNDSKKKATIIRDNNVHNEDESIKYERNVTRQSGCRYMKTLSSVNVEIEH